MPFAVVRADVSAALQPASPRRPSIPSHSPRLLDVAQSKVSLALEQLNFDQELFVVELLQLFQQLRSQSQSFVVSMRVIVQRHQTSLSNNHHADDTSEMTRRDDNSLRVLVEETCDFRSLPIRCSLGTTTPTRSRRLHSSAERSIDALTSSPVPASMSRNRSTSVRTSFAAFALLTRPKNGRVLLINNAKATTHPHHRRSSLLRRVPLASLVSLKTRPRARMADSLMRTASSSSADTSP